jgi:hypothetical protein
MNLQELKNALTITGQNVTIAKDTLTPNISDLIDRCYLGQPILITGAQPGPGDGQNETIVIQGRSSFLNILNLPVVAQFSLDSDGNAQVFMKYALLGPNPGPSDWHFSHSFPKMPGVIDWNKTYADPLTLPLDELSLFNAYYVVTSHPQTEPEFQVSLETGINFVSKMRPTGIIGVVESIFGQPTPLTLYGTIRIPKKTEMITQLKPFQQPWDITEPLPGICLKADLGVGLDIGKMQFNNTAFRIYSPHSIDWLQANSSFNPFLCYSGRLSIPSAEIEVDMLIPVKIGANELFLLGNFKGVQIGKLAAMLDFAGTSDLISHMPDEIKKIGDALGKIELMHAGIGLFIGQSGLGISGVNFMIGIPELNWKVWENHFEIDSITCSFHIDFGDNLTLLPKTRGPLPNKSKITVTVFGKFEIENVPCNIFASNRDGFTIYAELAKKQTIPLKKLMETYVPGIPAPSDLTINILRASVTAFKSYSMALAMAQEPDPWIIPIGPTNLKVSDVTLLFAYQTGGKLAGSFGGSIALGDFASMSIRYDIPGDIVIRSLLPDVSFKQLINVLANQPVALPGDFDLHFTDSSVLMQKQAQNYLFQLATEIDNFGTLAFQIQKISSKWGFAVGLDLRLGKVSTLPGLDFLKHFEDIFALQKLLLVVSSFDNPGFQFPDLAAFQNPALSTKKVSLPAQADGVVAGLNVYAEWVIKTSDKQQNLLMQLLGLDPVLGITLQVSENPARSSRLYVSYQTNLCGHPLSCKFGGQISDGSVGIFLTGTMTIDIQGHPQTFDVTLLFVENGAFISADMKGPTAIDFEVFKIGNLAAEIGINWEGVPSLGVAGTIDVDKYESSIAVFFDAAEPQKSMVAGAICDLNLKDVLDTLTGDIIPSEIDAILETVSIGGTHQFEIPATLAGDLDNLKLDTIATAFQSQGGVSIPSQVSQTFLVVNNRGSLWYLTDLITMKHYQLKKNGDKIQVSLEAQFYCAPQATSIGTITFPQGFFINGHINFFGFNFTATIEISTNKGIGIDAEMDKIVIGHEKLFSIKAKEGDGGPRVSISTFEQPEESDPAFRKPHFFINGELNLLGLTENAYINLTMDGLKFDINHNMIPGLSYNLHGTFDSLTNMNAGGGFHAGIPKIDLGPLGTVDLKTGAEGSLEIGVNSKEIYARVKAGFKFAGETLRIPDIDLDIETQSLVNLADILFDEIKESLEALFTDPEKWAKYALKGFIEGVSDVAAVLEDCFGKTAEEAKKIIDTLSSVCPLTTALFHM